MPVVTPRCSSCNSPFDPTIWSGMIGEDLVYLCVDCHHGLAKSDALSDPSVRCLGDALRHADIFYGNVLITEREV